MRKRPVLIAAVAVAAGVIALGTVAAQQPTYPAYPPAGAPTYGQPKAPATGALPGTTVRPYNEWTPQPAGAKGGAVRPAGGSYLPPPAPNGTAKAKLAPPGTAGTPPIQPAGGIDLPPPSMNLSDFNTKPPAVPAVPPAGAPGVPPPALPPPSLSVEGGDNKLPPSLPAAPPFVPVPGGPAAPPVPPVGLPALPTSPVAPPAGPAPKPFPVSPALPAAGAPGALALGGAALPNRVRQEVEVVSECPESVVFGVEFGYTIVVRNTGNVPVQGVRVEDEVPAGARYVGSDPPAELTGDRLVWAVGALDARAEKRITVRVRPTEEGEMRSRATVSYAAAVEARTRVTRPRIAVTATAQETARAGEAAKFVVKVTNGGTGPAQKLVLRAELSDGLFFSAGAAADADVAARRPLETRLDALAAGETKSIELPLVALRSGVQSCQFTVTAEGAPDTSAKASVNVVEPMLRVAQTGPAKCLVRAEPTYEIALSNPGTAATDPITVHAVLPDGFDFVSASDGGGYVAAGRAASWKLQGLPAGGTKTIALKLRATAAGDGALRTVAVAGPEGAVVAPVGAGLKPVGRVLEAKAETPVRSEGVAAVRFEVKDLDDPVLVGTDAVYEIRVTNQGTGECTNVQLLAALAEGTTFTGATGGTKVTAQGQTLVFEPIAKLPVKGETVYTVRVKGNAPGDMRFRVQLTCDQVRTPVVKEESTSFYKQ